MFPAPILVSGFTSCECIRPRWSRSVLADRVVVAPGSGAIGQPRLAVWLFGVEKGAGGGVSASAECKRADRF